MTWTVEYADDDAEAEVERLSSDLKASFRRIVEMIRSNGLERTRGPYVKHLEGKLWEMRLKGRDGIARSLYVTATDRRSWFCGHSSRRPKRHRAGRLRSRCARRRM